MVECELIGRIFSTPWGYVGIAATDRGLERIVLPRRSKEDVEVELTDARIVRGLRDKADEAQCRAFEILEAAEREIAEYLAGKRTSFDVPLAKPRATDFMRAVWRACSSIPYGKTRPYQWIAERIGRPKASRAVGTALGANPLPLIVPCHRVVRGDGTLGGFGGGLALKERLLNLECGKK